MAPGWNFPAGRKYSSPYSVCESATYVIMVELSADAPLLTRKLVHAEASPSQSASAPTAAQAAMAWAGWNGMRTADVGA